MDNTGRDLQREVIVVAEVREHHGFGALAQLGIFDKVVSLADVDDIFAVSCLPAAADVHSTIPPEPG
jgi:hypothetical protein